MPTWLILFQFKTKFLRYCFFLSFVCFSFYLGLLSMAVLFLKFHDIPPLLFHVIFWHFFRNIDLFSIFFTRKIYIQYILLFVFQLIFLLAFFCCFFCIFIFTNFIERRTGFSISMFLCLHLKKCFFPRYNSSSIYYFFRFFHCFFLSFFRTNKIFITPSFNSSFSVFICAFRTCSIILLFGFHLEFSSTIFVIFCLLKNMYLYSFILFMMHSHQYFF